MSRLRALVWLIALVAFIVPPLGTMSLAHAAMAPEQAAADCPEHAPPPDCPAQGTAKHAAGQCCSLMACAVALLPPALLSGTPAFYQDRPAAPVASLAGLAFTKDPPPPRV